MHSMESNRVGQEATRAVSSTAKSSGLCSKLKSLVIRVLACVREVFAFFALVVMYLFPLNYFDPKKGSDDQQPIVLVHGYAHNSSAWIYHRQKLINAGFNNVFTVDLGAIPTKSIEEYSQVLHKRIQEVQTITGRSDIILVGHSMGGVVSSHYAVTPTMREGITVTHVVTVNSPLRGTKMHHFAVGPCVRDMAYESEFSRKLSEEIPKATKVRFLHIASEADIVVLPFHSALNRTNGSQPRDLSHIQEAVFKRHGHTSVMFSADVAKRISTFLSVQPESV